MKIYLVRHGEIPSNRKKIIVGRTDELLTKRGRDDSYWTARTIVDYGISHAYCSPLKRARKILSYMYDSGVPYLNFIDECLTEQDFGDLEGTTYEKFMAFFGNRPHKTAPRGENWKDVQRRVKPLLKAIIKNNEDVAIISHGSTLRVIICTLLGIPLSKGRPFYMDNCAITTIEIEPDGRPLLRNFNNTDHL
jgi:broad specificity phosphatase PhoE